MKQTWSSLQRGFNIDLKNGGHLRGAQGKDSIQPTTLA